MCGRFIKTTKIKKIERIFEIQNSSKINNDIISYNIAPSQKANVIIQKDNLIIENIKWGIEFLDKNNQKIRQIINSRLESINEKILFKDSYLNRRCLIPTNGYYEWTIVKGIKIPYFIEIPDQELFFFAAIWKYSDFKTSKNKNFSIITKPSNNLLNKIHHRMPVILNIDEACNFIYSKFFYLNKNFTSIIERNLDFFPVSKFVNAPYNNSKLCIQPLK